MRCCPPPQCTRAGHGFYEVCVLSQPGFLTPVLSGFVKIYPPPQLPRDYRPVHYFRPVVAATSDNAHLLQVLSESSGKAGQDSGTHSRHQLNASKRGELLGETPVQGMCSEETELVMFGRPLLKWGVVGSHRRSLYAFCSLRL